MKQAISGVIALLVSVLVLFTTPAATARPPQASGIGADYVVLVDISGSMNDHGRYGGFRAALPRLLDDLDPADRLSVYTFDSVVRSVYSGPAIPADDLVALLPAVASADAVTDLGPPIAAMLAHLHRPGAAPIATLVLVTDGQHNPPTDSAYVDLWGLAWDELARSARSSAQPLASVYAVLVGAGVFDEVQVARILGPATVLRPDGLAELGQSFADARERVTAAKRSLWESEEPVTAHAVEVPPDASTGSIGPVGLVVVVIVALGAAVVAGVLFVRRRAPTLTGTLEVRTGRESAVLTRLRLDGERTLLDDALPGSGWVVAAGSGVRIAYSRQPGSEPVTRQCPAGQSVILGGHTFSYLPAADTHERRNDNV